MDFAAIRSDNASDPLNGTLTDVQNRKMFTFRGRTASDIYMTIMPSGNVGVGTTSPSSVLDVEGPISTAIAKKTTNYTLTATDRTIEGDASSGAITITLPSASGISGRIYVVTKIDSSVNKVTITRDGTDTFPDGSTSQDLTAQGESLILQANSGS